MPISEKEHFDALRAADQRAIELLAKAQSERTNSLLVAVSILVAIISLVVAIGTLVLHR